MRTTKKVSQQMRLKMCGDNVIYTSRTHTHSHDKKMSNKIALGMSWNFTEKQTHRAMCAMSTEFFSALS